MGDYTGPRRKQPRRLGTFSDTRAIWTDLAAFTAAFYLGFKDGDAVHADGSPPVVMVIAKRRGAKVGINLTDHTAAELRALKDAMNQGIDFAIEAAERLDECAKEAFRNGDDTVTRVYRPVPDVFVRERKLAQYLEGVQSRSSELAGGVWRGGGDAELPGDEFDVPVEGEGDAVPGSIDDPA